MKYYFYTITIPFFLSCSSENNSNCFSPTQNLENAYNINATGCDCDPEIDIEVCVKDKNGRKVALFCFEGRWIAVEDGACFILPD